MRNISKTLIAAGTAVLVGVGGAHAAGAGNSWDGFYAGLQAGYNWGDAGTYSYWDDGSDAFSFTGFDVDGFAGGVYAGYQMGVGSDFVLGVEAEANLLAADDRMFVGSQSEGFGAKVEHDWDASLRLKAGLNAPDFMPYLTGGLAFGGVETSGWTTWGLSDNNKETLIGWTVGAGVEVRLTDSIHARIQYRYTDYGSERWALEEENDPETGKVDYTSHMIMAGVSFRF